MIRLAGVVLIISVLCFGIGATRPVVLDYYDSSSVGEQSQLIRESLDQWQLANRLMDLGVAIVPIGVALLTLALHRSRQDSRLVLLAAASTIALALATYIWLSDLWAFPRFTLLMALGIILVGIIIWRLHSRWSGGLTISSEVVIVVLLYITLQDVPPGAHYLPLLLAGLGLLISGDAAKT